MAQVGAEETLGQQFKLPDDDPAPEQISPIMGDCSPGI